MQNAIKWGSNDAKLEGYYNVSNQQLAISSQGTVTVSRGLEIV
jgi:hypothetical protein